jgi:NADH dehydrogenase FAD-containing subunit
MSSERRIRIVMLGGGFRGLCAARHFDKTLARDPDVGVTRVNREHFIPSR